jgi:hypothetical protein
MCRGQVDAAIKLYRGLLVSMAHHPQMNTERTSAEAMSVGAAMLADMHTQGFAAAQLAQYEQELREPPPEDLQALEQMLGQQQWVNAEIAARMMVNDYPDSATAQACLQRVVEMGVVPSFAMENRLDVSG